MEQPTHPADHKARIILDHQDGPTILEQALTAIVILIWLASFTYTAFSLA